MRRPGFPRGAARSVPNGWLISANCAEPYRGERGHPDGCSPHRPKRALAERAGFLAHAGHLAGTIQTYLNRRGPLGRQRNRKRRRPRGGTTPLRSARPAPLPPRARRRTHSTSFVREPGCRRCRRRREVRAFASRNRSGSTGNGRITVEFFSAAISTTVCSSRSCSAVGLSDIVAAARESFCVVCSSPSAVMTRAPSPPLRIGLPRYRPLNRVRPSDVLDLHAVDVDATLQRVAIDHDLEALVEPLERRRREPTGWSRAGRQLMRATGVRLKVKHVRWLGCP